MISNSSLTGYLRTTKDGEKTQSRTRQHRLADLRAVYFDMLHKEWASERPCSLPSLVAGTLISSSQFGSCNTEANAEYVMTRLRLKVV